MGILCQEDQTQLKYIFVAGAPGSKWSSVVKNIYYSPSIDRSDYRDEWTYYHDAGGQQDLMHLGAYWDPGMACPLPEDLSVMNKQQAEASFDHPFDKNTDGIRIIKSHIFSYENNVRFLRQTWPDVPIVLVHRSNDACLGWWVKCGHFDITYPSYRDYYKNLGHMASIITQQNAGIVESQLQYEHSSVTVNNNRALCRVLGIEPPPEQYWQNYAASDIKVTVI
jgi:hypothetical protein